MYQFTPPDISASSHLRHIDVVMPLEPGRRFIPHVVVHDAPASVIVQLAAGEAGYPPPEDMSRTMKGISHRSRGSVPWPSQPAASIRTRVPLKNVVRRMVLVLVVGRRDILLANTLDLIPQVHLVQTTMTWIVFGRGRREGDIHAVMNGVLGSSTYLIVPVKWNIQYSGATMVPIDTKVPKQKPLFIDNLRPLCSPRGTFARLAVSLVPQIVMLFRSLANRIQPLRLACNTTMPSGDVRRYTRALWLQHALSTSGWRRNTTDRYPSSHSNRCRSDIPSTGKLREAKCGSSSDGRGDRVVCGSFANATT